MSQLRTIYRERIRSTDPRLGRHVWHDSEARRYEFDTTRLSIVSAAHIRRIPVLDQGDVGSCTGNAGVGCLGTDPFYATVPSRLRPLLVAQGAYSFNEAGALALYSDAETLDGDGPYPPQDNGSTGASIAKVLHHAGQIGGYTHTFSIDAALKALGVTPFITGVSWFRDMFTPDPDGRVHPTGALAGGHEFVADAIDAENERVWFTNSWGVDWGVNGRFYLSFADYGSLLAKRGDVTIFAPLSAPAPVPTPVPADSADTTFASALRTTGWIDHHHVGNTAVVAHAAKVWLVGKGL